MSKPKYDFSDLLKGLDTPGRVTELERQVAALTKECDRLRAELVEANARNARLAKLHATRGA